MKRSIIIVLLVWQFLLTTFLTLGGIDNAKLGVMAKMLWGVNLLWIVLFGLISLRSRDYVSKVGESTQKPLPLLFFLGATLMALLGEAVTTAMTNCAPIFGAEIGEVYITASANYLDVVMFHSAVVFLPQYAILGWLLSRYAISPFAVFICYGITGFIGEVMFSGPNPLMLAQWILIYGLFVYLPAHLFVASKDRKQMRWWMYPFLVVLPVIASIPMVALLLLVFAPGHPSIHFPPM
ncbi:hypothetical protein [Crateriforma spongiae]|uniref:hypothetical protein n=1 Tax=Crateriforma spongiae TaxID=2724528 RepID=UPI0039B0B9EC